MALGYFIDIQGTLLSDEDKSPIEGSIEFIEYLNKLTIPYVLVTNNTKQKSEELVNSLEAKGFTLKNCSYIDPFMVLKEIVGDGKILPFGSLAFCEILPQLGFKVSYKNPDIILIASDDSFSAKNFAQMIDAVISGAKLVGMHGTSTYVKYGKRYPGVGAILAMIEYATGAKSQIVGKPSRIFYKHALKLIQQQNNSLEFHDITMISDDAIGDLAGAKELGINTSLVLSGKCKSKDEAKSVLMKLDTIYPTINDNLKAIQ